MYIPKPEKTPSPAVDVPGIMTKGRNRRMPETENMQTLK
jgi:hypothetical protein